MKLFYRETGEGKPIFILHGLFGMSDNWATIGKQLAEKYRVIMPDLRNHGNSFHHDDWDYDHMAKDILQLANHLNLGEFILIGHSMGGKVAMKFAQEHPDLLEKFIVIDIAPRYYPVHHQTIIKALKSVNINQIKSRSEAENQLSQHIGEEGIRLFLMKNLGRNKEGFYWKFNLNVISENIENVGEEIPPSTCVVPALFIRGSESEYINNNDTQEIKGIFSNSMVVTIKNAGHWVHADQPEALISTLTQFIDYRPS